MSGINKALEHGVDLSLIINWMCSGHPSSHPHLIRKLKKEWLPAVLCTLRWNKHEKGWEEDWMLRVNYHIHSHFHFPGDLGAANENTADDLRPRLSTVN